MTDDAKRPFTNATSDLPIPASDKRDRFEAEGDSLGALGWRCSQAQDFLAEISTEIARRDPLTTSLPEPPSWGDVRKITKTLETLGHLAVYLGMAASFAEVRGQLGLPDPEGDR